MVFVKETDIAENDEFDVEEAVRRMQEYWNTYDEQHGYKQYSEETFLADAIYGIGLSVNPKKYQMANGFRRFIASKLYDFARRIAKEDFDDKLKGKK